MEVNHLHRISVYETLVGVILHFKKSIYTGLVYEWRKAIYTILVLRNTFWFNSTLRKVNLRRFGVRMEASNLHQLWTKKHFLVYKNNFPSVVNLHQIKVKLTTF